ncbi:unnamed protein product [Auanema sp. JU1783]|nr:unnamed protein product [Auanema sp. JU1783]
MSVRSYCGPPNPCINILGSLRDTTVDGGLYMYETNNIIKGHRASFFGNLFGTGSLRRTSYYSSSVPDPLTDRSMLISTILNKEEKRAVLEYVGNESSLLAVGVCELLEESNGSWQNPRRGVVCLIKENPNKIYSISLLKPSTTKIIWCQRISRSFQTTKDHDHLVTFEIGSKDTNDTCIYGLNFYDAEEALRFHSSVMEQYESHCARNPHRVAPQRPAEHSSKPIVLTDDSLSAVTVDSTEELALPLKTKKNSLFGGFFSRKNKKKKKEKKIESKHRLTPDDISNPTDFEHLCGADYTTEEREAVQILKEQIKFDENDPGQRELLRKFATEHHAAIRASIRAKPNESFQRGTSGLEGARSSIMIHKTTKGYTPREIKRTSGNKKNESIQEEREPTSSADEDKNSNEEPDKPFDPVHPDWEKDSVVPSFSPRPPSHSTHSTGYNTHRYSNNNNEYDYKEKSLTFTDSKPLPSPSPAPPAPTRTASRNQFVRQNTPPHPRTIADRDPSRPRLPGNDEPIPSRLTYHFTRRLSSSPPSSPPPVPISSPIRPPPPISSKASGSVSPPPIPPPPVVHTVAYDTISPPRESSPCPPPILPPTLEAKNAGASSVPKAPPPPPPCEASPPSPPPLPPTLLVQAAATSPVRNAPPPPPPLGGLNLAPKISSTTTSPSLSPGPPVSPDRRSFLDEIQNVDKSKLLRSPNAPSLPQKQNNEVDGSIMSSIQRMMDSIRPQLGDSDSDSDDSTSTDSDWSE